MRYVFVIIVLCGVVAVWLAVDTMRALPAESAKKPTNSARHQQTDKSAVSSDGTQPTPTSQTAHDDSRSQSDNVSQSSTSANIRWANDGSEKIPFQDSARGVLTRDPFDRAALLVAYEDAKRDNDARLIADYGMRLMRLDPGDIDHVLDCVAALVRNNRLAAASQILAAARARDPNNEVLLRNFATIEQAQGRVSNALDAWSKILALSPEDFQALSQRGLAYLQIMDWPSARDDLERAHKQDAANVDVALDLAKTYENLDEFVVADQLLHDLQRKYPRDVRVLNQRAVLAWQSLLRGSNKSVLNDIISWLDQSLEIAPGQSEVIALRSRVERLRARTAP